MIIIVLIILLSLWNKFLINLIAVWSVNAWEEEKGEQIIKFLKTENLYGCDRDVQKDPES
jgi:hypothetical protein